MILGFTGTREGMSTRQITMLQNLFRTFGMTVDGFHHGGQVGADLEAAARVRRLKPSIYVHPCPGVVRRHDESEEEKQDHWLEVFPPLVRNRHIVEACDLLIAAPLSDQEVLRSGTWATIRYAKRFGKPHIQLWR